MKNFNAIRTLSGTVSAGKPSVRQLAGTVATRGTGTRRFPAGIIARNPATWTAVKRTGSAKQNS